MFRVRGYEDGMEGSFFLTLFLLRGIRWNTTLILNILASAPLLFPLLLIEFLPFPLLFAAATPADQLEVLLNRGNSDVAGVVLDYSWDQFIEEVVEAEGQFEDGLLEEEELEAADREVDQQGESYLKDQEDEQVE